MKKKFLGRVLTMLLVASMVFTLLPAPAIAAGNWWWNNDEYTEEAVPTATTDNSNFMRIFHLDCGRKYFSVAEIESIIDQLAANNYTHIELAFGNDGLRFLLDDMSLTVNGTKYESDDVKGAIQEGNKNYHNAGEYNELTESQMTDIINYAKGKNIEVIPLINTPGHMDAILSAATSLTKTTCSYNGSKRTIDVTNATAVAFTKALLQKYINYFAGKGCKYFNMGADEYANDKTNGFSALIAAGEYGDFIKYVNAVAGLIKKAKMTPIAFNDGIYYDKHTQSGTFDNSIVISFWTAGWGGYYPASASFLTQKGHKLINTNDAWYYVLGRKAGNSSGYNLGTAQSGAKNTPCTEVRKGEYDSAPDAKDVIGCMQCLWCDTPSAPYNASEVENVKNLISTFSASNPSVFTTTPTPPDGGTTPAATTIPVPVNGTYELKLDGNVEVVTGTDYNSSIAGYTSVTAPETTPGGDQPVSEDKLSSTFFYIKSSDGKYLTKNAAWTDKIENAAQWQIVQQYGASTYKLKLKDSSDNSNSFIYSSGSNVWLTNKDYATKYSFDGEFYYTASSIWGTIRYTLGTPVVKTEGETKDYTTVTFTGKTVGTTYVTIGGTKYKIEVTDKAPDTALIGNSITLEHWITNNRVTNTSNGSTYTVSISKNEAVSGEGIQITSKLFSKTYWGAKEVHYWKSVRLSSSNKQVNNGADQTAAGTTLTAIRYYGDAWQYKTVDENWHYFEKGDQLVAYYLLPVTITPQIGTYYKDWGYDTDSIGGCEFGQVALSTAVVYPDGTISPVESNIYGKSTTIFNYWNNGSGTHTERRDMGIVMAENNSDYEISKITVTNGLRNGYQADLTGSTNSKWTDTSTINWAKVKNAAGDEWYDETIVWDESYNTEPVVNAANKTGDDDTTYVFQGANTAKLVLIYLKPIEKEDNLNIVYYNDNDGEKILSTQVAMKYQNGTQKPTFANSLYQGGTVDPATGAVSGGTLIAKDKSSWLSSTVGDSEYLPDDAYVVNAGKEAQTFTKQISTIPGVAPKYKSGVYKYNGADISDDGKTLTLHYVLDESKLTLTYVFDFGLPINIPVSDLVGEAANSVETVYVGNTDLSSDTAASQHGKLTYNKSTQYITYEPTKAWTAQGLSSVTFKVAYNDGKTQNFTIGVLPASNVLYEENFLTEAPASNGLSWTQGAPAELGSQETQKAKANGNVFGYDNAYVGSSTNPVTGELGAWTATGLEFSKMTKALTTEFYGNGFDLIGSCGPDTGRVMIAFTKQGAAAPCRVVMVNTRFTDSKVATTLHQVPWAHVELGVNDAMYKVEIFASGNETNNSSRTMLASSYAAETDAFDSILAAYGMSASDVEYINVADTITVPSAYAVSYASVAADVPANQTIEVDGFRVYRSTTNDNYPANEKNVTYTNILDVVKGEITAYTENGSDGKVKVTEYEKKGGPQNEIYLSKDQSVTFQVGTTSSTIQVSLRAVSGKTSWATSKTGDNPASITSNTEMYYPVTTNSDGSITIVNRGEGLLAIGNVKLSAGAVTQSASEMDKDVVLASVRMALGASGESNAFNPAINAKVTTTRFIRSKVVTLTVSASADVEKLMVNGVELRPTNSWLVKMGWSDTYTYILTEKVPKSETKTYEIVGYRADGAASAPIVVKSK